MNYSDIELLNFLEENHYKSSYENLCILKEGLANGTITLEEKKEEVPEEKPVKEEKVEKENIEVDSPKVTISMPADGSIEIQNGSKTIASDAIGNMSVALSENNTNRLLKSYIIEDCNLTEKDFTNLTEDAKIDSVKELAVNLFKAIEEKLSDIDTSCADRSRGDIKALRELQPIQDTLTKLEALVERDENGSQYMTALNTVIKSILYLNQYSAIFKEAYRNKKTVMILKYQSIVLSIISTISYMLSTIVDYSDGTLKLKNTDINLFDFAPFMTLKNFISSIDSGEFKTVIRDVNILREYYLEVPVETMSTVLEATGFVDSVVGGVKNLYTALTDNNGKVINLLYKAAGVITLLFSLRDVFYTLFRMRTKVSDMLSGIQIFSNLNNGGGVLNKLSQFASKFKVDAEYGSDITKREIEGENRQFANQVKTIQNINKVEPEEKPAIVKQENPLEPKPVTDANDDFIFDF